MTLKRDDGVYVGVCYEFAIVLENKNHEKLMDSLEEAAKGYIQVVRENNLPNDLLDKHKELPKEFQSIYVALEKRVAKQHVTRGGSLPKEYKNAIETGRAQLSMACV